jgi:hypothetical protein
MNEPQDPEAIRQTPVIDHAPAGEPDVPPERSAPPPPAAPPPAAPRRGGTPFAITLLFTAALGGGIYWTWTHPRDVQAPIDPAPAIDAAKSQIQQQIDQLNGRIAKLEQAPPPAPATPPQPAVAPAPPAAAAPADSSALADVGKRLDDLAGHMNDLGQQQAQLSAVVQRLQGGAPIPGVTTAPQPDQNAGAAQQQVADLSQKLDAALAQEKSSLDTLTERLSKLEQAQEAGSAAAESSKQAETALNTSKQALDALAGRVKSLEQGEGQIAGVKQDAVLAVKLTAAQAALANGQPLGELPGAPPALARFADTAPPTEASLKADYPAAAKAALVASRPEELQRSFLGRALARLEQAVTVRQGDHVIVGDPAAGILAKAQQALYDDDLKGAVDTLGALSGPAAQAMQPWISQANALLAARAALASMAHS